MATLHENEKPRSERQILFEQLLIVKRRAQIDFRSAIDFSLQFETFSQEDAIRVGTIIASRHLATAKYNAEMAGGSGKTAWILRTIDREVILQKVVTTAENGNYNPLREYFDTEARRYKELAKDPEEKKQKNRHLKISGTWEKIAQALPEGQQTNSKPITYEDLTVFKEDAIAIFSDTVSEALGYEAFSQKDAIRIGTDIVGTYFDVVRIDAQIGSRDDNTERMIKKIDAELRIQSILTSAEVGNYNPLREYFKAESTRNKELAKNPREIMRKDRLLKTSDTWQKIADALPTPPDDS